MPDYESDAVSHLTALGFGDYEARVYLTLLQHGPLSGYEIGKRSGVPRANVYQALQKLEERQAVTVLTARRGEQHAARPAAEMLKRLEQAYEARLQVADAALQQLPAVEAGPMAVAVVGKQELLARAGDLIEAATEQVIVGVAPATAPSIKEAVGRALARGVQVTTLCLIACPAPCGACQGALYRQERGASAHGNWLMVVVDDQSLLAADLDQQTDQATGIVTHHPAMVGIAASFVRDGIAAAEVVRSLGGNVLDAVDGSARDALHGATLADSRHRSWLEQIRARLARPSQQG